MEYCSITTTNEAARMTVKTLGELSVLHVVDLADDEFPSKQHQIHKRAVIDVGIWERKLDAFQDQMKKYDVYVPPSDDGRDIPGLQDVLAGVASYLEPVEKDYLANLAFMKENKQTICSNEEWISTLKACKFGRYAQGDLDPFADDGPGPAPYEIDEERKVNSPKNTLGSPLLSGGDSFLSSSDVAIRMDSIGTIENNNFRAFISGTIPLQSKQLFHRALYRMSRGNAIATFYDIPDGVPNPTGDEPIPKSIFDIMVIGKQLATRVRKLCASYDAAIYKTPGTAEEFDQWIQHKQHENSEKQVVLDKSLFQLTRALEKLAWDDEEARSPLRDWQLALRKEKGINYTLMKAHFTQNLICIEGWIPAREVMRVRGAISRTFQNSSHPAPAFEANPQNPLASPKSPPTFFDTGTIMGSFQTIVDTYGVPRYREANPGLFTAVTFPFLFGVMYGDIGHGLFLLLFALYICSLEKKLAPLHKRGELSEVMAFPFAGRHMLVLMAIFAIYNGFIYNDCMAMPIFLYESQWTDTVVNGSLTRVMESDGGRVYPFGVDPKWLHKQNELEFFNSMKNKMAIILGICQMMFGLLIGGHNHCFFKNRLSLWLEWVPQMIFMSCTFGYMCVLIVLKWCTNWSEVDCPIDIPDCPPSILQAMLHFFLNPGSFDESKTIPLFKGQGQVQAVLILLTAISVPVMLFGKPCVLRYRMKQAANANHAHVAHQGHIGGINDDEEDVFPEAEPAHDDDDEEHSFGDIMIHQTIHTIEFVLGAVSNTASYLRLWALSLAHSQLASVFWNKIFLAVGLERGGFFTFIAFPAWFGATFGVLLAMDVLECILHALRLHWVEFQGKFYSADGYLFVPFNFEEVFEN